MMRAATGLLWLLLWPTLAFAQADSDPINTLPNATPNSSSYTNTRNFLQREDADRFDEMLSSFVVSGGLHSTAGGLSATPSTLTAYAGGYRITQAGVQITYTNASTCWVVVSKDATGNLGSYTRVTGSHYLSTCVGDQYDTMPTLPADSAPVMKVLTSGGAITRVYDIRRTGPVWDKANAIDVTKVCAVGNDSTDNVDCFSRLFMSSGYYYIPEGTYRVSRDIHITLADNIYVKLHPNAVIKYTGGTVYGAVVAIRNADNIVWDGGVIDANLQGNDNGFAVSGQNLCESADFGSAACTTNADCTGGGTGICRTDHSKNIWFLNARVRNCRHAAGIGGVGAGGGKGFTLQFGNENVNVDNVVVDDCDIGFSVESKQGSNGAMEAIKVTNVTVRDADYVGAYIFGTNGTPPSEGDLQSIILDNIDFDNCATDRNGNFGVITFVNAHNVLGRNLRVRNSSGGVTPVMGTLRHSDIDVFADVYDLGSLLDFNKDTGPNGTESPSRHNKIKATVKIRNDVVSRLVTTDTAGGGSVALSDLDLGYYQWDGVDYENKSWPVVVECVTGACTGTAEVCTNNNDCSPYFNEVIPDSVSWTVRDLSFGRVYSGHGPYSPRVLDDGGFCTNGWTFEEDKANKFIAARPCDNDYQVALRDTNGNTVLWASTEGLSIGKSLRDASYASFVAQDATPDVTSGTVFVTANTQATTITDFDQTPAMVGQMIWVIVNDAFTTVDCTASGIHCNGGADLSATSGDVLQCVYAPDNVWKCVVGNN